MMSSRGCAAAIFDVGRELCRTGTPAACARAGCGGAASRWRNRPWSASGTPSSSATTEKRERLREAVDELALARVDELGQLAVGEAPHELLVLPHAPRGQQLRQQSPVGAVLWRIERRELIAERKLVAVLLDDVADILALERYRELLERPAHHVARGEVRRVGIDGARLVVARDHEDAVVRLAPDGRELPQRREVRVRVILDGSVGKEVPFLQAHGAPLRRQTQVFRRQTIRWARRGKGRRVRPADRGAARRECAPRSP